MTLIHPHPAHRAPGRSLPGVALAVLLLAACASARRDSTVAPQDSAPAQETFVGTVVYEVRAGGPNAEAAERFNTMGPTRESVTWGSGGRLRVETEGGELAGVIIARMADSAFFSLDSTTRVARRVKLQSLNLDDVEPHVLALLGERLAPPELERTDEERSYAGHRCRMYTVRSIGMLPPGTHGRACVAEDIRIRASRYLFRDEGDVLRQMAAVPVQLGVREGLPLMLELDEAGAIVTYKAVSLIPGEPADALFSVPADYTMEAPDTDG
jgi:hypothetical protein